jgi:hypothetical protein
MSNFPEWSVKKLTDLGQRIALGCGAVGDLTLPSPIFSSP